MYYHIIMRSLLKLKVFFWFYFCESELLVLNTSCIHYYFNNRNFFTSEVLKETYNFRLRICLLEKCKPVNIARDDKNSNTLMIFNYKYLLVRS